MSEQEGIYPTATKGFGEQRKALAPKTAEAFKAFTQSVFAEGAVSAKTKQLIAVAVRARDSMSVLHPRAYKVRLAKRSNPRGDHGGHLGRRRNAGRGSICPFHTRARYDSRCSAQTTLKEEYSMFMKNLLTVCESIWPRPGTHLLVKKAFGYKEQRQKTRPVGNRPAVSFGALHDWRVQI